MNVDDRSTVGVLVGVGVVEHAPGNIGNGFNEQAPVDERLSLDSATKHVSELGNGDVRRERNENVQVWTALVTGSVAVVDARKDGEPFRIVRSAAPSLEEMPIEKVDDGDGDSGRFVLR